MENARQWPKDGSDLHAVDDPDAFYEPWSGMRRYRHMQQTGYERICAEGNRHLFDWQMPMAEQPDF